MFQVVMVNIVHPRPTTHTHTLLFRFTSVPFYLFVQFHSFCLSAGIAATLVLHSGDAQYFHEILNQMNFWPQTIYVKYYCRTLIRVSMRACGRVSAAPKTISKLIGNNFSCARANREEERGRLTEYSKNHSYAQRHRAEQRNKHPWLRVAIEPLSM